MPTRPSSSRPPRKRCRSARCIARAASRAFTPCRPTLFGSTEYRHLVEVHADLLKQVGSPPFDIELGDRKKPAETFSALRQGVLDLSRHGVALQRFKGLGEMNADQLRETTMDPATRTLQRVTIDDAALAETELMFTDLMGDKVEPRKVFIEKHAKEVGFLDV